MAADPVQPRFSELPASVRVYVATLATVASAVALPLVLRLDSATEGWPTFGVLALGYLVSELVLLQPRGSVAFSPASVVTVAAALLLPLELVACFGVVAAASELLRLRRAWYKRLFNVSIFSLTAVAAWGAASLAASTPLTEPAGHLVVAGFAAALPAVVAPEVFLAPVLLRVDRCSWRDALLFARPQVASEFGIAFLGAAFAALWLTDHLLVVTLAAPIVLTMRALRVTALEEEAATDAKTELLNARSFSRELDEALARASRLNRPLSLVMADLDYLRTINNTYGHLAGDAVLEAVAGAIKGAIRRHDVAARFGGEEFCVLLPDAPSEEAVEVAERIRAAVAAARIETTAGTPIAVTVSAGVASLSRDAATSVDLLERADEALYVAKEAGRNRVVLAPERVVSSRTAPAIAAVQVS